MASDLHLPIVPFWQTAERDAEMDAFEARLREALQAPVPPPPFSAAELAEAVLSPNAPAQQWEDAGEPVPTTRPVFPKCHESKSDENPEVDGCGIALGACGLVTVLAFGVLARFAWEAASVELRVVTGCLLTAGALWWWRDRRR